MELLIILSVLFIIGVVIIKKSHWTSDYDMIGFIISMISGIYLILHIVGWSVSSYSYNVFLVKRNAFVETLKEARKGKNQFEVAAITKDVSEWNQKLAEAKYDNNIFLLKDYVDDRVINLQPIK